MFTEKLKENGLTDADLYNSLNPPDINAACEEETSGLLNYYNKLYKLTETERDNLLMAPQFSLFNENIKIGISEKLNVLERETVKYYRSKLMAFENVDSNSDGEEGTGDQRTANGSLSGSPNKTNGKYDPKNPNK